MKSIKNLVLKGMVAGMTMVSAFGVVAPNTIYAAENDSASQPEVTIATHEDVFSMIHTMQSFGRLVKVENNTYYLEIEGVTYAYTYVDTCLDDVSSTRVFNSKNDAYDYGMNCNWYNIQVTPVENSETGKTQYMVSGQRLCGTFSISVVETE